MMYYLDNFNRLSNCSENKNNHLSVISKITCKAFLPAILLCCCFTTTTRSQLLKVGVFDIDVMVHAMPQYKNIDSLVIMSTSEDDEVIFYELLRDELKKNDSVYSRCKENLYDRSFCDSAGDARAKLITALAHYASLIDQKLKERKLLLAKPLYDKVNAAFLKVVANEKYDLIIKPGCIVTCDNCTNLFVEVAKELKVKELPDGLADLCVLN